MKYTDIKAGDKIVIEVVVSQRFRDNLITTSNNRFHYNQFGETVRLIDIISPPRPIQVGDRIVRKDLPIGFVYLVKAIVDEKAWVKREDATWHDSVVPLTPYKHAD